MTKDRAPTSYHKKKPFTLTIIFCHPFSAAPQETNRCSSKPRICSKLLLHITSVCLWEKFCIIYKEHKRGWPNSSLQKKSNQVNIIIQIRKNKYLGGTRGKRRLSNLDSSTHTSLKHHLRIFIFFGDEESL